MDKNGKNLAVAAPFDLSLSPPAFTGRVFTFEEASIQWLPTFQRPTFSRLENQMVGRVDMDYCFPWLVMSGFSSGPEISRRRGVFWTTTRVNFPNGLNPVTLSDFSAVGEQVLFHSRDNEIFAFLWNSSSEEWDFHGSFEAEGRILRMRFDNGTLAVLSTTDISGTAALNIYSLKGLK